MRALLIDPDDDTRELYREHLRRLGWQVDEASDGRIALAKAISIRPDAIVTETRLPGLGGVDLCRVVRADPQIRRARIVVLTGDVQQRDIERARAAGADAVLTKPCPPNDLAHALSSLLEPSPAEPVEPAAAADVEPRGGAAPREAAGGEHRDRGLHGAARPLPPPEGLFCPRSMRPLRYLRSFVGGVKTRTEQWDYFECPGGCGEFRYRVRTRKLTAGR
jgi:CheY-like chemotaxis protein